MKYIENFASLIPSLQGNKVIQRIEKMKETGEIQTEAEYNDALNDILSTVSTTDFIPTFEYIPFQESKSSSEHFNFLMDRIKDDLDIAFTELNNIFAAIKAHDSIFKDKLLDELHYTLKRLEDETENLILIHDSSNSFDEIQVNSFSGENFTVERNNLFANELFYDQRKEEKIQDDALAFIDNQEETLGLPLLLQADISFAEVKVKTAESTGTEVNIEVIDSEIENIIDSDVSSGWAYNILVSDSIKEGASLSLELDLGDKREINYLIAHPISDFPMLLEKIQYTNINNNLVDIPDSSYFGRTLDKPIRITFTDIIARKIIFRLKQQSSVLFDYDQTRSNITLDDLKRNNNATRSISVLSESIRENIQDPDLLSVIPLTSTPAILYNVYYQYIFAFKSINAGLSAYRDDGYFISKPYRKNSPALLGLEVNEIIPEYYNQESALTANVGSLEYEIIKKDYNSQGEIIKSLIFPILPNNVSGINNERLFFSSKRKNIPLRFLAHGSDNKGSGVKIYRNDIELIRGVDWRFYDRLDQNDNGDENIQSDLFETKIEIMHIADVIRNGIYTASYIPRYISEPDTIVKDANQITYLNSGVTEHTIEQGIDIILYSDIYIKIAIRNNSFESSKTARLNYYKLLMSSVNEDRYVRI